MEYIDRLLKSIELLEGDADKLSKLTEVISSVAGLTEEVRIEKEKLQESQKQLKEVIVDIHNETKSVSELSENIQREYEKVITVLKDELLRNKKENIECIETISTTVANKLMVTESNITTSFISKISAVESNINTKIEDGIKERNKQIKGLETKSEEHKEKLENMQSVVKHIRIAVILSIVIGVINILVSILV